MIALMVIAGGGLLILHISRTGGEAVIRKIVVAIVSVVIVFGSVGLLFFLGYLDFTAAYARRGDPYSIQALMFVIGPGIILLFLVGATCAVWEGIMDAINRRKR